MIKDINEKTIKQKDEKIKHLQYTLQEQITETLKYETECKTL